MSLDGVDETTPVTVPIKFEGNRELATHVANLVIEAKTHSSILAAVYTELCELTQRPPMSWQHKLVETEENYFKRMLAQLAPLRSAVG